MRLKCHNNFSDDTSLSSVYWIAQVTHLSWAILHRLTNDDDVSTVVMVAQNSHESTYPECGGNMIFSMFGIYRMTSKNVCKVSNKAQFALSWNVKFHKFACVTYMKTSYKNSTPRKSSRTFQFSVLIRIQFDILQAMKTKKSKCKTSFNSLTDKISLPT